MGNQEKVKPIGLYGCYCHPFKSWEDLKYYENQKIEIGAKYKERHNVLWLGVVPKTNINYEN